MVVEAVVLRARDGPHKGSRPIRDVKPRGQRTARRRTLAECIGSSGAMLIIVSSPIVALGHTSQQCHHQRKITVIIIVIDKLSSTKRTRIHLLLKSQH